MKSIIKKTIFVASRIASLAIVVAFVFSTFAFAGSASAEATSTSVPSTQGRPTARPLIKMKNEINHLKTNAENNKDARNERMEVRASTTEMKKNVRENISERKELVKKMRRDAFELRLKSIVRELNLKINSLINLQTRAVSQLNRAKDSGKDVSAMTALFATAEAKISKAKSDVTALANLTMASSSTQTASSTSEIDLSRPRELAKIANDSIRDAREALKIAIKSLPKMNNGDREKVTPNTATSTATSTNNSATSTQ